VPFSSPSSCRAVEVPLSTLFLGLASRLVIPSVPGDDHYETPQTLAARNRSAAVLRAASALQPFPCPMRACRVLERLGAGAGPGWGARVVAAPKARAAVTRYRILFVA
jgi:hypothetical protein